VYSPPVELGVYVHFPWCRERCPYCDFAIAVAKLADIPHQRYADAVLAELEARAPRYPGRELVSIYFGGGTPALWHAAQIERVIRRIRERFPAPAPLEITVEANPNDCTPRTLAALAAAGVNRLSIGAQAFRDDELVQLGRDHDARAAAAAVVNARAAGFASVSLDLIFALPGRSLADWQGTLARALELAPDHLSVYQLTVEERTPLYQAVVRGEVVPAPDDDCAEQFLAADAALGAAGYQHYEVSSYARPGRRARHNSLYWRGVDYLGLGNGAHSLLVHAEDASAERFGNHRSVVRYLAAAPAGPDAPLADDPLVAEHTVLDAAALAADQVWLGLRTADGIERAALRCAPAELERLVAAGLLTVDDFRVRPTARGLLFADEVGARLSDGL
jgi:putative oxygen-independent coproporphyrinogen III oxidase